MPKKASKRPAISGETFEERTAVFFFNLSLGQDGRLKRIVEIIEGVEMRCMSCDGPVGKTSDEITDQELRRIYLLAKGKVK